MTGANYMGGKRNAARARTKDVAGRTQKRHFGKQRLASALCRTRNERVSKPTLPSVLQDISLAHARRRSLSTAPPAEIAILKKGLSSSPAPEKRRPRPSKVLQALDTSDHTTMRAAINRILERPDFVGLKSGNSRRSDHAHRDSLQKGKVVSSSGLGSDDFTSTLEQGKCLEAQTVNTKHPTSLSRMFTEINNEEDEFAWGMVSDDSGYAEPQDFTWPGDHFHYPEVNIASSAQLLRDNTFSPLPPSSPLPWDSQSTDHMILDLDTTPPAPCMRPETWAQDQTHLQSVDPFLRTNFSDSSSQLDILATSRQSAHGSLLCPTPCRQPIWEPDNLDIPSLSSETTEFQPVPIVYAEELTTQHASPDQEEQQMRNSDPPPSVSFTSANATMFNDIVPGLPLDVLADPDPWATIGKILDLHNVDSYACRVTELQVSFTREREGVGFVRDTTDDRRGSFGGGIPSTAATKDSGDLSRTDATNRDAGMSNPKRSLIYTPEVPMTVSKDVETSLSSPVRRSPSGRNGRPFTEVESLHTTVNESKPAALEITAKEDVDATYDGPCLFVDSDFSEDD